MVWANENKKKKLKCAMAQLKKISFRSSINHEVKGVFCHTNINLLLLKEGVSGYVIFDGLCSIYMTKLYFCVFLFSLLKFIYYYVCSYNYIYRDGELQVFVFDLR